jgi:hypothetical protein
VTLALATMPDLAIDYEISLRPELIVDTHAHEAWTGCYFRHQPASTRAAPLLRVSVQSQTKKRMR